MQFDINDKILLHMTNYLDDDLKNIINDDMQSYGKKYHKINIYNKNIKIPLQKIWLLLPQVKLFKPVFFSNNNYSVPLTVVLGPNVGNIKKFYMFIKKLERIITNIIKDITKNKNLQIKSCIRSAEGFPPIMHLKMPCNKINDNCYEFTFHIYNHINKRISLKNIEQGTYTTAFIELSDVWISESEYGFNWNILQMKLIPEFNFTTYLFKENTNNENKTKNNIIEECYHCLYCPNAHVRTHMCVNENNIPIPPPPPPLFISQNITKKIKNISNDDTKNLQNDNSHDAETKTKQKGFAITINDLMSIKLKPVNKKNETDTIVTNNDTITNVKNNLVKKK